MLTESPSQSDPQPARVPNFPIIHEDELLYSLVARYGFMSGYTEALASNLDLFGHAASHAACRLPSGLAALADRLPRILGLDAEQLVLRHTLMPYYSAYFSTTLRERVIKAMLALDGRASRAAGIDAKPLAPPRRLRFCPGCLDAMETVGQDLHWKRVHQLAIVAVCPEHECDLRESAVSPGPTDRVLHPATRANCHDDARSVIPQHGDVDREALFGLAVNAQTLLAGGFPVDAVLNMARSLAEVFRDLGYRRRGRLNWELLGPDAQAAVAGLAPLMPEMERAGRRDNGWFDHAMDPNRPGRSDRVLIAAILIQRIEAIEPRFWQVIDWLTGHPLMRLDAVA